MAWVVVLLIIGILVWVQCARAMSVKDRIEVALDIARSSNFEIAEGFEAASREDPDLIGWMQAGQDCVMLFRSTDGNNVREVVDFLSGSFHPGLVIHYQNGRAIRTDEKEVVDARLRKRADQLLLHVRRIVKAPQVQEDFGYRY
jgi:hypothetical protein